MVIFATATILAFVLLRNSRFNFHCYTQREATPTQKLAWKCAVTSRDFLRKRLQSAFTLANQLRWIAQYKPSHHNITCSRLRNLVRSEIWSCACILSTTLLLPSTAICAGWNSKCHCHQAYGKYRFTNSVLRFTPKWGWQLWKYDDNKTWVMEWWSDDKNDEVTKWTNSWTSWWKDRT